jgi:hypothetical protein
MAEADHAQNRPEPEGSDQAVVLPKGLTIVLMVLLFGFILSQTQLLWSEWYALRDELTGARRNTVVGYQAIHPNPSYAEKPSNWFHDEGEYTLLWSGWKPGVGHGWFRVGRGDIDRSRIAGILGRDVIQAIDRPVVEVGGGRRWELIPSDEPMAALVVEGVPCVYPLLVLKNVEVVNDEVERRPVLVTFSPFAPEPDSIQVYDPMVEGRRVNMGLSGYFHDRKPLLYDRGTESLWVDRDENLTAIAGPMKGARLARAGRPSVVAWGDWRSRYPRSRLVVGADRSRNKPAP